MPVPCLPCTNSALWVLTAAFLLLYVPTSYILPIDKLQDAIVIQETLNFDEAYPENPFISYYQSAGFLPHCIMVVIGTTVYLFDWIHRKLLERRILKLRTFLGTSLERLRETDARRDKLEGTLKLARSASAEYNLLLFLLLRARKDAEEDI